MEFPFFVAPLSFNNMMDKLSSSHERFTSEIIHPFFLYVLYPMLERSIVSFKSKNKFYLA